VGVQLRGVVLRLDGLHEVAGAGLGAGYMPS
jgi:hypothetical protein